jgi:hypothetical protein
MLKAGEGATGNDSQNVETRVHSTQCQSLPYVDDTYTPLTIRV